MSIMTQLGEEPRDGNKCMSDAEDNIIQPREATGWCDHVLHWTGEGDELAG